MISPDKHETRWLGAKSTSRLDKHDLHEHDPN